MVSGFGCSESPFYNTINIFSIIGGYWNWFGTGKPDSIRMDKSIQLHTSKGEFVNEEFFHSVPG